MELKKKKTFLKTMAVFSLILIMGVSVLGVHATSTALAAGEESSAADAMGTMIAMEATDYAKISKPDTSISYTGTGAPGYGTNAYKAYGVLVLEAGEYDISVHYVGGSETVGEAVVIVNADPYKLSTADAEDGHAVASGKVQLDEGSSIIYCVEDGSVSSKLELSSRLVRVNPDSVLVQGDANGDDKVNVIDLVQSKKVQGEKVDAAEKSGVTGEIAIDFDDDGTVGNDDVKVLRQLLVGAEGSKAYNGLKVGNRYVASTDGVHYKTFAEAVSAAKENGTVTLIADAVLDNEVTIDKALTVTTDDKSRRIVYTNAGKLIVSNDTEKVTKAIFLGTAEDVPLIFEGTGSTVSVNMLLYLNKVSDVIMKNVTMQNANRKTGAGAIFCETVDLTLEDCSFKNCKAANHSGAFCCKGTVTASNCSFENCTTGTASSSGIGGGAVYLYNSVTKAMFEACIFADCNSGNYPGGAIYSAVGITLKSCIFSGNSAGTYGGAVHVANQNIINIDDCTFSGNEALSSYGGAVSVGNASSTLNLSSNCSFTGNKATGNKKHFGGAILAPANLIVKEGAYIIMTGNECTGSDCGDAISINATSNTGFIIESGASLYIYDNPEAGDSHKDVSLRDDTSSGNGTEAMPGTNNGIYSTEAPSET